jgi:hypothetical protein
MMFAQANSEHCRHKIFNANFIIDGVAMDKSLFGMIRNTHQLNPQHMVVAYSDNSSVMEGSVVERFSANFARFAENNTDLESKNDSSRHDISLISYKKNSKLQHVLMKVETHNHPTAISPFAGAATGAGGEIRDEGATGRGSKPKAGLTGFAVSKMHFDEPSVRAEPVEALRQAQGERRWAVFRLHSSRHGVLRLFCNLFFGMRQRGLADPGTVVPSVDAGGEAFFVAGAITTDDLPEFRPVNRPHVVMLARVVPLQQRVGQADAQNAGLLDRGIDKLLPQIVVADAFDTPAHGLLGVG